MIPLDPIGNVSPLPPIELRPQWKASTDNPGPGLSYSPAECDRLWSLIEMTAKGTNVSDAECATL